MRWSWCAAALLTTASLASGQGNAQARLAHAVDAPTRIAVLAIVDSARVARLPADILINKALEGAEKHADGPRIVAAVRALAGELRRSRDALGHGSRSDEITAGAHALHAGVSSGDLTRIRRAAVGRELTTPLTVLTDLVSRGVPPTTASNSIVTLAKAGLHDADFSAFQRSVRVDIDHGADPSTATITRTRGAALRRGGAPVAPDR